MQISIIGFTTVLFFSTV